MSDTAFMPIMGLSTAIQVQEIELIKKGKKENPTWINLNEKVVKWYKCPCYMECLSLGDKKDAVNWSCINCNLVKEAQVGDLVVFRARRSINKEDLQQILKFEVLHQIKVSKTDTTG